MIRLMIWRSQVEVACSRRWGIQLVPMLMPAVLLFTLWPACSAVAQTTSPQRVVNENHHFAYTVEAGAFISMRKGGNGFSAIHKPRSAGDAAYGLLVFGSPDYSMSEQGAAAAREAGKLPTRNAPVNTQDRLNELVAIDMNALGRKQEGSAEVRLADGKTLGVPVYSWTEGSGNRQRYALMYVVLHGESYIAVQVESQGPLSAARIALLTTGLELL